MFKAQVRNTSCILPSTTFVVYQKTIKLVYIICAIKPWDLADQILLSSIMVKAVHVFLI